LLLWILIALLTAAAILAVLIPLGRTPIGADADTHARQVYLDQLKELERDKAEGRMSASEAEAARAEIVRRLLATDSLPPGSLPAAVAAEPRPLARRTAAGLALVGIPLLSLSLYLGLGAPNLPGAPLAARLQQPPAADDIAALIAKVEAHLAEDPQDGRGWEVIAPVYLRLGRGEDAVRAYESAIRLLGSTAERQIALGQAILAVEGGIVTAEAREAFEAANALDPAAPEPRFFMGVASEQEGNFAQAAVLWRDLLAEAPADAPWRGAVEEALANVDPRAGSSSTDAPEEPAAPESIDEQTAMIEGMVSGLADRLESEPDDVDGWLRLIRSYVVLGRTEAAAEAARDALAGVANTEARERVQALIAELGVTPAGATTQ
jgi:cytochrome c-type biogenesis protein CcmH